MQLPHIIIAAILGIGIAMDVILYRRQGRIENKLTVVWEFLYRRAMIESLKRGFLTINSPLQVRPDLRAAYDPILPELCALYVEARRKNHAEPDIAIEIEQKHREWIIDNICRPFDMDRGECLVIAVEVAKSELEKQQEDKP
jgi:hypothetical protein